MYLLKFTVLEFGVIVLLTGLTLCLHLGDRSFFMREGALVGFGGGGALEKNWLERGGQPKKNEGKGGGSDEKNRLKIG